MKDNIPAGDLGFEHLGEVVKFMDGDTVISGELREIHHSAEATWIHVLDDEPNDEYGFKYREYELRHLAAVVVMEGE